MTGWLEDTRASYDTVAESYARRVTLDGLPVVRGVLALFAERVRAVGGPVVDAGCGPGHVTARLRDLGLDVVGIDLSPEMVRLARRDHPGLRFEVGSMTALDVPDGSVGGVLAWYSIVHVPDEDLPTVAAALHRVLRPGGVTMLGFHLGDRRNHKTEGYGGLPMRVDVHHRPVERVAGWLRDAGFVVEAHLLIDPDADVPGGVVLARRGPQR
ncbi:class I SAM-dependent methyltransferase [Cellulomonas sp. Leaf334]|uniref:class I SAM-dependent DNA methyltransferase n=1 Tax=Cellulomonas sp. Leaf334 TaxID=1736339 RepID=UPI000701F955|nr:class I SAM-dependent methyltransferase [Cellulomonas sp. Leaf334]KQR17417.1 methyltransferase [Cellulomonas sp. Leaf334]